MRQLLKSVSPLVYIAGGLCFFLPFTHISCSGEKVATFTGVQLITGTEIETSGGLFGQSDKPTKRKPEPLAIAALCAMGVGFVATILKRRAGTVTAALTGGAALLLLLLLKAKIDNEVLKEGEGILRVEYGVGFWAVLLLMIFAAGSNLFLTFRHVDELTRPTVPPAS